VRVHFTFDAFDGVGYLLDGLPDACMVLVVLLAERVDGGDDDAADGGHEGDDDAFHQTVSGVVSCWNSRR
jgi:hypothetical protein